MPTPTSKTITYAFNDDSADIILATPNGDTFRTHRLLLTLSSPVFATMFQLPDGDAPTPNNTEPPTVTLDDDPQALRYLLNWCDPRGKTDIASINEIAPVLELADKYEMKNITRRICDALQLFKELVAKEPLRVFAIATRYGTEGLIRAAALESLNVQIGEFRTIPELNHISGWALQSLYDYRSLCVDAATKITMHSESANFVWDGKNGRPCSSDPRCRGVTFGGKQLARVWFVDYMKEAKEALQARPRGHVVKSQSIITPAIQKASGCLHLCSERGYTDLAQFTDMYQNQVERVIAQVQLKIQPGDSVSK